MRFFPMESNEPFDVSQKVFTQQKKDTTSGKYYKSAGTNLRAPEQIDPKKL